MNSDSELGQPVNGWRTLAWIVALSLLLEVGLSLSLRIPKVRESQIGRYFAYGTSVETKILEFVENPELPPRSVFYAGWLDPTTWPPAGQFNDLAIYGMSFAGNLASGLRRAAPDLNIRMIGGPGAPLSHSYAAYGLDVRRRVSPVVVITLLSRSVTDMAGMTHDTSYNDHSQPATWPVYGLTETGVEVKAWPEIDSAADLRRAITTDRDLWNRHLDQLATADPNFNPFLYSSHWTENFVLGRALRRAWAKSEEREWSQSFVQPNGRFKPNALPSILTREVLRAFIHDVRKNAERPIVVLFSEQGAGDNLLHLVQDVLEETQVPTLLSEDYCASDQSRHYANLHFLPSCDDLMAAGLLKIYKHELAQAEKSIRENKQESIR